MDLEESTCLTSDYTTKPQSSRQCGIGLQMLLNQFLKTILWHPFYSYLYWCLTLCLSFISFIKFKCFLLVLYNYWGPRTAGIQYYFSINASLMASFKSQSKILSEGDWFVSVRGGLLAEIKLQIIVLFCFDGSGNNNLRVS